MTTELYISCYIACLIGNIIHIAMKASSTAKDYKRANMVFTYWQFIKDEKVSLIADAAASLGLVYLADEWIDSPYVMGKIKTAFILVGFTGSYIIMYFTSISKKKFRETVDEKTDKADGKL